MPFITREFFFFLLGMIKRKEEKHPFFSLSSFHLLFRKKNEMFTDNEGHLG